MSYYINNWNKQRDQFKQYCELQRAKYISALQQPQEAQQNVLNDILAVTTNSEFGRQNSLHLIKDVKALRELPIRSYDHYLPLIDKEVQKKGGVLSDSRLVRWLKTSGSTGNSKRIPYTEHWMSTYRTPALGALWGTYLHFAPEILDHPFATLDTQSIREPIKEMINGIPYQSITNRNPLVNENDWQLPWYEAPWFSPEIPEGYDKRMYCRLRFLLGQDLRVITAINPSTLIALHQQLVTNAESLLKEIHDGTLFNNKVMPGNPELAKRLGQLKLNDITTLKECWPNLSLVTCWTSASARLYREQLDKIYPGVRILPFMTCGTEGVVTIPVDDHETTGPLAIHQGIYEFLPADDNIEKYIQDEQPAITLLPHELELGKEYHLVMTQANGLYRLAVGDVYKVVGFYGKVPRIEFSHRQGTFFSFTGEKITESQMLNAVQDSLTQLSVPNGLFMCFPVWEKTPYYKVLIEFKHAQHHAQTQKLADLIDQQICKMNSEYQSKRDSARLDKIDVCGIKEGTIHNFIERKKSTGNATQIKYKPLEANIEVHNELLAAGTIVRM